MAPQGTPKGKRGRQLIGENPYYLLRNRKGEIADLGYSYLVHRIGRYIGSSQSREERKEDRRQHSKTNANAQFQSLLDQGGRRSEKEKGFLLS